MARQVRLRLREEIDMSTWRRWGFGTAGTALVGGLLAVWFTLSGTSGGSTAPIADPNADESAEVVVPVKTADLSQVDLENKTLPRIPPGTVVGKVAPKGWTN